MAYASRALSPAEQKYSVGEREALACIWACDKWHIFLFGRRCLLRTDHQALTSLLSASGTGQRSLRLHRWMERLCRYTFRVEYRPGRCNQVADLLSRSPAPIEEPGDCVVLDQISLVRKVYRKYRKQTLPLWYLDHIMALSRGRHDFTKDPSGSQKHCFL